VRREARRKVRAKEAMVVWMESAVVQLLSPRCGEGMIYAPQYVPLGRYLELRLGRSLIGINQLRRYACTPKAGEI
jgi:hypothetical protein